jgi:hypothetical protein
LTLTDSDPVRNRRHSPKHNGRPAEDAGKLNPDRRATHPAAIRLLSYRVHAWSPWGRNKHARNCADTAIGCWIGEVLADQILKVRHRMNIHYGVFNGEKEALNFVRNGEKGLEGVSDILLYTDGLSLSRSHPEEDDDIAAIAIPVNR